MIKFLMILTLMIIVSFGLIIIDMLLFNNLKGSWIEYFSLLIKIAAFSFVAFLSAKILK